MAGVSNQNYSLSLNPQLYGDQEAYYQARETAIKSSLETIQNAVATGQDLTSLLFDLLDQLGAIRYQLALTQNCENKEKFGVLRTDSDLSGSKPDHWSICCMTPLGHHYEKYNQLVKGRIANLLKKIPHNLHDFSETSYTVRGEALGRKTKYQIEVITPEMIQNRKWDRFPTLEELTDAASVSKDSYEDVQAFIHDIAAMRNVKKANPSLYNRVLYPIKIRELNKVYPSPFTAYLDGRPLIEGDGANLKSLYIIGTQRLEINGKLYALSGHLSWMYTNYVEDPVERFEKRSVVFLNHQDHFLIEPTLKECGNLFKDALDNNYEDITTLKSRVALFRYLFAHCLPYKRGSASVGEWLEAAIYHFHGFTNFRHNQNNSGDLEALSSLMLADFLEVYDQTIDLGT